MHFKWIFKSDNASIHKLDSIDPGKFVDQIQVTSNFTCSSLGLQRDLQPPKEKNYSSDAFPSMIKRVSLNY